LVIQYHCGLFLYHEKSGNPAISVVCFLRIVIIM
jgi:hypothetical protein